MKLYYIFLKKQFFLTLRFPNRTLHLQILSMKTTDRTGDEGQPNTLRKAEPLCAQDVDPALTLVLQDSPLDLTGPPESEAQQLVRASVVVLQTHCHLE